MELDFSFYEKIVDGWERTETENGVPYYVNHITECTSWDHPYWLKILEALKDYETVKYAAYRTAQKIAHIQKHLLMHHVELYTLQQEFEDSGYVSGSHGVIGCSDLLTLLISIYQRSRDSSHRVEETEMFADLTLNLLLNIFDKEKMGTLDVLPVKLILVVLCSAKLTEKYRYFYQELHDPSTFISTHALAVFLQAIMKLPDFLHESLAFGRTSEPAVASCEQMVSFQLAASREPEEGSMLYYPTLARVTLEHYYGRKVMLTEGRASGGITEDVFYNWLQKGPQTIVWLPTLHRLLSCQTVSHDAKCNVCKCYPITGLRYKCLKCFNFNMCQNCFFTGKTSKRHTAKHPTQEYCTNSTTKDDAAAFVKTLKNNLSRKHRRKSCIKYLPIEADSQYTNPAWSPGKDEDRRDIHADILETARKLASLETQETINVSPSTDYKSSPKSAHTEQAINSKILSPKDDGLQKERDELNAIIQKLEHENRLLYEQLSALEEPSDVESVSSDSNFCHSLQRTPNKSILHRILKETQHLPIREPLPVEATPIFLSVPIVNINRYQSDSFSCSPKSSIYNVPVIYQPDFSLSESFSSPYPTHSSEREITPPNSQTRGMTLGASVDALDTSPSKFSLPSPTKSYDEFNSEEAELRDLVNEAGLMFPKDLSFGRPISRSSLSDDEMFQAANSIQCAMSDFLNQAVNIKIPK